MDAQTDLSLRWAHRSFVGFVMRRLTCTCTSCVNNANRLANSVHPDLTSPSQAVSESALFDLTYLSQNARTDLGLVTRKPVFGGCDQLSLKLACSAIGTSYKLEILHIETTDIILSKQ